MQIARLQPYFGSRTFYKGALSVMVPIILQQLINAAFNMVDHVLVANINQMTMSAVSVANRPYTTYSGILFGFMGAGGLLLSQFYGAKQLDTCQQIFSVEMLISGLFSVLFTLTLILFPAGVMGIFIADPQTIAVGVKYLRVEAYAYLPMSISLVCVFSMRSLGFTFLPMVVSIATIGCNALFDWLLIFGKLGMPALGVEGAALGTVIARLIEMGVYLVLLARRTTLFSLNMRAALRIPRAVLGSFFKRCVPLTFNELLWSTGMQIYFYTYTHISEVSLPAINVADQVFNLAWVFFTGMSSAVSVLVGKSLGAGDFQQAKSNAKRLMMLGVLISFVCMATAAGVSLVIGVFFPKLTPDMVGLAQRLIWQQLPFYALHTTYAICFFLLRAGGDTTRAMILDSFYMWVVPVPAALAISYFLPGKIDIRLVVLAVDVLMNLKVFWALRMVKKGTWLQNLTLPTLTNQG